MQTLAHIHTFTNKILAVDSFKFSDNCNPYEQSRRKEKTETVQMTPPKVSSICGDRCDRLHSVASNSTMTLGLVISTFTVWYHRTSVHINGAALAFDDL